jgi:anti-sigma-K factor RskA
MIDEQMEEMASLYVLGELKAEQAARFEAELLGSAELQEHVSALQEDFACLALAAPMVKPPAGLRAQLIQQFRAENVPTKVIRVSFLPWAIAAALAVASTFLFLQQSKLQKQVAELKSRDLLAQTRVAVLQSQVETYASGSAVVVWDVKNQKGIVRYEKLPQQEGLDYQLWALDPAQKTPVDAGLMPVGNTGSSKVEFHPSARVGKGTKFAVSVEKKGGSKTPAGPVIFVGE